MSDTQGSDPIHALKRVSDNGQGCGDLGGVRPQKPHGRTGFLDWSSLPIDVFPGGHMVPNMHSADAKGDSNMIEVTLGQKWTK